MKLDQVVVLESWVVLIVALVGAVVVVLTAALVGVVVELVLAQVVLAQVALAQVEEQGERERRFWPRNK